MILGERRNFPSTSVAQERARTHLLERKALSMRMAHTGMLVRLDFGRELCVKFYQWLHGDSV